MAVKIGVVGAGVHGMHHVRLLSKMPDATFTAVYDSNPETCAHVAEEFGLAAACDLDGFLDRVDCVSVAVPTSYHFDVVSHCLERGRHVLVEKPIAATVKEADDLIDMARGRGLVFGVGHIERFNAAYRSIQDRDLAPAFIEAHRLAVFSPRGTDVAVVLDLMIHDIDVILGMVRSPVVAVNAVGVHVASDEVDIANARLEFANGCVANLTASRISQRRMRKTRIFQKSGYISMDFATGETEVFAIEPGSRLEPAAGEVPQLMDGISYAKYPNDGGNALEIELRDFVTAVESGGATRVTADDGRDALDIAAMVMESMEVNARRLT